MKIKSGKETKFFKINTSTKIVYAVVNGKEFQITPLESFQLLNLVRTKIFFERGNYNHLLFLRQITTVDEVVEEKSEKDIECIICYDDLKLR